MATSGAFGAQYETIRLVEKAVRMCGVQPAVLGAEQLESAVESLQQILTALSNRGVGLWCVERRTYGVPPHAAKMLLAPDTVDVLNVSLKRGTALATFQQWANSAFYDFGVGASGSVASVAARFVSDTGPGPLVAREVRLEYSDDATTWTLAGSSKYYLAQVGSWIGVSADVKASARYWRMLTGSLTTTADGWALTNTTEITYPPSSRDEYSALPNKHAEAAHPTLYFFDKQLAPQLWLWPLAQGNGAHLDVWMHRAIQDVGPLAGTLDLPTRWVPAIQAKLAAAIVLELPKELIDRDRVATLQTLAETLTRSAEDGETDGAPLKLRVHIGAYTR